MAMLLPLLAVDDAASAGAAAAGGQQTTFGSQRTKRAGSESRGGAARLSFITQRFVTPSSVFRAEQAAVLASDRVGQTGDYHLPRPAAGGHQHRR